MATVIDFSINLSCPEPKLYMIMKSKIMPFIVVFVFVMSMFPMNVFANDISRHGTSHSSCEYGTVQGVSGSYTGYHTETYSTYRRCTPEEEEEGSSPLVILLAVGLIVWAVWPKDTGFANTNFEEVEDNLSDTESTNNWGWTASYDYEEDSYSLGASYGF